MNCTHKNVTAILESITKCDRSIREYQFILVAIIRGVGAFAPNASPCINVRYIFNVHCILFTLLLVFFYYIIKYIRGTRNGLGGAKPPFASPQKRLWY